MQYCKAIIFQLKINQDSSIICDGSIIISPNYKQMTGVDWIYYIILISLSIKMNYIYM